jgi:hypothetical protein
MLAGRGVSVAGCGCQIRTRVRLLLVGLYNFGFLEPFNLLRAEAELRQHFVGLLAEFRRSRHHPARRARQRHGLAARLLEASLMSGLQAGWSGDASLDTRGP